MASTKRRMVLDGVPQVAFAPIHDGQFEFTPFPSCLKAVCGFLGQRHDYYYLLSACGGAFRLLWRKDEWFGGNVDLFFMEPDPLTPYRRGLAAAGWTGTVLINDSSSFDDEQTNSEARLEHLQSNLCSDEGIYRERIITSIDAGRPVIAFGVVGPPEASIVAGYDAGGDVLIGWSMFQEHLDPTHDTTPGGADEMNPPAAIEENGYFRQTDWFRRTLGIITLDDPCEIDRDGVYRTTAEWIPKIIQRPSVNEFHTGLGAYNAYIACLTDDSQFPSDDLPALAQRKMVHYDAMTMIAERSGGARFVEEMAGRERFAAAREELMTTSGRFARVVEQMEAWWKIVGPIWSDEEAQIRAVGDPKIRAAFIPHIEVARDADGEAAKLMEKAMEKIG